MIHVWKTGEIQDDLGVSQTDEVNRLNFQHNEDSNVSGQSLCMNA